MTTTVFYATNRRLIGDPAKPEFSDGFDERLDELRYGAATIPGERLYETDLDGIADQATIEVTAETLDPNDASRSKLGSSEIYARVRDALKRSDGALLHIHGYDYTFRQSVARAGQLQQWLADRNGPNLVMMLFAWPSLGAGVAPATYRDDRQRAAASGVALGRAILKATDFIRGMARSERCDKEIHLMAHSMGNWTLRGAVQSMRTFVGDNIPPLFNEVMLMAADEDADTLADGKKLAPILRGCHRLTVYFNQQDLALKASDVAMGNPDRLGRSGPKGIDGLPGKIVPVNVSPVIIRDAPAAPWTEDKTGHQYYRNNDVVRNDVLQVLNGLLDSDIDGRTAREGGFRLG